MTANCTGYNATCPEDTFLNSSVVCRPAEGACGIFHNLSSIQSSTHLFNLLLIFSFCFLSLIFSFCFLSLIVNNTEYCTGDNATCPPDALVESDFICNPSSGICDIPLSPSYYSLTSLPSTLLSSCSLVLLQFARTRCLSLSRSLSYLI
jgi:hypothetical protein